MQRSVSLLMRPTAVLACSWRDQGISYLKYLNVTTESLHKCVGDAKRAKYDKFSQVGFIAQESDGAGLFVQRDKVPSETSDYGKQ